ncbi:MAG: prolipoprotein diacylglyceryl transferase [Candidatus Moraniibacteriota bacterium]
MAEWWQQIPEHIDPVAFSIGFLFVRWYAVCFLVGFFTMVSFLLFRSRQKGSLFDAGTVWDIAVPTFAGILVGGRFGYALLYDPTLFSTPLAIISPVDPGTGAYAGIHGMSFFGALFGGGAVLFLVSRARRIDFFALADFIVPVAPIALFFGRIGNFLNLELPGRVTSLPWGMLFPDPSTGVWELRHPSQLYEAFFEGFVLFLVLKIVRNRKPARGVLTVVFLCGYALVRFLVEFFREPDPGSPMFFGWMTVGQLLALILVAIVSASVPIIRMRWTSKVA